MREIKFRALTTENPKKDVWIYGMPAYFMDAESKNITGIEFEAGSMDAVDTKTVGQYTGRKDKNGVDIYEDDVLKYKFLTSMNKDFSGHVYFDEFMWCIGEHSLNRINTIEVIGNIHQPNSVDAQSK